MLDPDQGGGREQQQGMETFDDGLRKPAMARLEAAERKGLEAEMGAFFVENALADAL